MTTLFARLKRRPEFPTAPRRRTIAGGSPLYLLSAACILYGLSQLLVPLYEPFDVPATDGFYCVGAINLYELALLGVALLILWRNVKDDAVSLAVLIGLFLVASAATLNVVAAAAPVQTLIISGCLVVLAGVKLYMMHRRIVRPFAPWQVGALTVMAVWNFTMPNVLASTINIRADRETMLMQWRVGLLVMLIATTAAVVDLARLAPGELRWRRDTGAYLHTRRMAMWMVALMVAASWLHAYGQTFAFNLPVHALDLLPLATFGAVWWILVRRARGKARSMADMMIAMVPLALSGYVMLRPPETDAAEAVLRVIHHPGVAAATAAIGAAAVAGIERRRDMFIPMVIGLGMSIAACDLPTGKSLDMQIVHIDATLLVLAGVFAIGGLLFRQPSLGVVSAVLLAIEVYRLVPDAGWRWVGTAFLLLLMGAAVSLLKGDGEAVDAPGAAPAGEAA